MSDELLELALRVEAASGADRELDEAICLACYPTYDLPQDARCAPSHIQSIVPRYSKSIDAAMSLVPDAWVLGSMSAWPASPDEADNQSAPQANVDLLYASMTRRGRKMVWGYSGGEGSSVPGNAATPALALTAAALRARASHLRMEVE